MIFCNELTIDGQGQIRLTVCFPLLFTVVGADPPASQKTLENPSLAGALQFCRSRNSFSQGKPLGHTCRMVEGPPQYGRISAPQNRTCPRSSVVKSRLANRSGNLGSKNDLKEDPVMFLDWMLAGSFVLDLVAALAVRARVR